MSKTSTSTSKCGSCKRVVKDGDPSGIACDNCSVWYHGCSCAGLSQEDVTVMGRVSGCLWICSSVALADTMMPSNPKLSPFPYLLSKS